MSEPGRAQRLKQRSDALRAIREFFGDRDFVEIEPSLLVEHPGLELHIEAVQAGNRYLITSPEFQLKRLLCEGMPRIYALCRCFRAAETGVHHSVEFSMLEWYRAEAQLDHILADTEDLVAHVARAVNGEPAGWAAGRRFSLQPPFDRITVRELFESHLGYSLRGDEGEADLAAGLRRAGWEPGTARHWDDLFFGAFLDRIEPELERRERPTFVTDWPVRLGALARTKAEDPALVERFELYVGGLELANAFGELTDAAEQRRRFDAEVRERGERGKAVYALDERFLAALEAGMPESAGIALGVDRLVMLITGAAEISQIQAFGTGTV